MNHCATCKNYAVFATTRGYCYLNPPTAFESGVNRRPEVKAADPACSHHQPVPPGEAQPVREKTNPETPGLAAKAARQERGRK